MIGSQAGGRAAFFMHTNEFDADHARVSRGVEVTDGPGTEGYGRVIVFRDRYGNLWDLIGP